MIKQSLPYGSVTFCLVQVGLVYFRLVHLGNFRLDKFTKNKVPLFSQEIQLKAKKCIIIMFTNFFLKGTSSLEIMSQHFQIISFRYCSKSFYHQFNPLFCILGSLLSACIISHILANWIRKKCSSCISILFDKLVLNVPNIWTVPRQ